MAGLNVPADRELDLRTTTRDQVGARDSPSSDSPVPCCPATSRPRLDAPVAIKDGPARADPGTSTGWAPARGAWGQGVTPAGAPPGRNGDGPPPSAAGCPPRLINAASRPIRIGQQADGRRAGQEAQIPRGRHPPRSPCRRQSPGGRRGSAEAGPAPLPRCRSRPARTPDRNQRFAAGRADDHGRPPPPRHRSRARGRCPNRSIRTSPLEPADRHREREGGEAAAGQSGLPRPGVVRRKTALQSAIAPSASSAANPTSPQPHSRFGGRAKDRPREAPGPRAPATGASAPAPPRTANTRRRPAPRCNFSPVPIPAAPPILSRRPPRRFMAPSDQVPWQAPMIALARAGVFASRAASAFIATSMVALPKPTSTSGQGQPKGARHQRRQHDRRWHRPPWFAAITAILPNRTIAPAGDRHRDQQPRPASRGAPAPSVPR